MVLFFCTKFSVLPSYIHPFGIKENAANYSLDLEYNVTIIIISTKRPIFNHKTLYFL